MIHITRGYSRDHRPDLNQGMLDLIVEHQAGIPGLMKPLSGHSSDVQDFGQVVTEHIAHLQTTYGTTDLVADSALYRAENLQTLVETRTTWITRVPATLSDAQAVLAQAAPPTMTPLMEGYRDQQATSTYGGVPQRWLLVYSDHRRPQAQRLVDNAWLKQSAAEAKAFQQLCHTAYACAEDAHHALTTFAQALQATSLHEGAVQPTPRYRRPGRPSPDTPPARIVYRITGALASSLDLKKPERIRALLMVMTVCLLVCAALESRIRQTLKAHQATFPNQKGQPVQKPTALGVFQYFVGIHVLRVPGQGAFVLNLNEPAPATAPAARPPL